MVTLLWSSSRAIPFEQGNSGEPFIQQAPVDWMPFLVCFVITSAEGQANWIVGSSAKCFWGENKGILLCRRCHWRHSQRKHHKCKKLKQFLDSTWPGHFPKHILYIYIYTNKYIYIIRIHVQYFLCHTMIHNGDTGSLHTLNIMLPTLPNSTPIKQSSSLAHLQWLVRPSPLWRRVRLKHLKTQDRANIFRCSEFSYWPLSLRTLPPHHRAL